MIITTKLTLEAQEQDKIKSQSKDSLACFSHMILYDLEKYCNKIVTEIVQGHQCEINIDVEYLGYRSSLTIDRKKASDKDA